MRKIVTIKIVVKTSNEYYENNKFTSLRWCRGVTAEKRQKRKYSETDRKKLSEENKQNLKEYEQN